MKFSNTLILGALATFAAASESVNGTLVPAEAVMGGLVIPDNVIPVLSNDNNATTVVFLNSTVLTQAKASNAAAGQTGLIKRATKGWRWVCLVIGEPFF